jgi:hypothetical protein
MDVNDQEISDRYAIYNGDSCQILPKLVSDECVHLSVYSPPFCGLYNYSSSDRDLSNCRSYDEFFQHYEFIVREIHRLTLPGRITAVHCMDMPSSANADRYLLIFPATSFGCTSGLGFITSPVTQSGKSLSAFGCEPWPRAWPINRSSMIRRCATSRRPIIFCCFASMAKTRYRSRIQRARIVCRRSRDAAGHSEIQRLDGKADRESLLTLDMATVRVGILGRRSN